MSGRGPLPPIPSSSSFNSERDMRGVRPGRTLEQKAQVDSRRSSFGETSSRTIAEGEEEVQTEEKEKSTELPQEPSAPKPGNIRSDPMSSMLQPSKQVILTSKPVFSNLLKKRNEESAINGRTGDS